MKWTAEEEITLAKYAQACYYTELVKVLPGRSVKAILSKADRMGIKLITGFYTLDAESEKYVRENWGKMPLADIARNLNISLGILDTIKKNLNLPSPGQQIVWTEEKIADLREYAKTHHIKTVANKFQTSKKNISRIAQINGIPLITKVWDDKKDAKLLKLAKKEDITLAQIASKLHMVPETVRRRLKLFGITRFTSNKPREEWTEEQVRILREMAPTCSVDEIIAATGKTESQVRTKASKLKIKLNIPHKKVWGDEDTDKLLELHNTLTITVIAYKMGLVRRYDQI